MRELSQHILDLAQNGLEAGAGRINVEIDEDTRRNRLTITVQDNGRGMDQETLKRVTDPFFTTRTTRHVGLGVPLLKAAAERCDGRLVIASQPGVGTEVVAEFVRDHIDRAPLGNMTTTLLSVILAHEECELHYRHRLDGQEFEFDTRELREVLGDIPLAHPRVRDWLQDYIRAGLAELEGTEAV